MIQIRIPRLHDKGVHADKGREKNVAQNNKGLHVQICAGEFKSRYEHPFGAEKDVLHTEDDVKNHCARAAASLDCCRCLCRCLFCRCRPGCLFSCRAMEKTRGNGQVCCRLHTRERRRGAAAERKRRPFLYEAVRGLSLAERWRFSEMGILIPKQKGSPTPP